MMTLSTHVLDTVAGRPAASIPCRLFCGDEVVFTGVTDGDGRCPALGALSLEAGPYRLEFEVAAYFQQQGYQAEAAHFYTVIPISFTLKGEGHTHVPLLLAPHGYSTYRGS